MAEDSPAFQWYPGDYLSDGKVQLLTSAQEGIYARLWNYCWKELTIPADPKIARQLCKPDASIEDVAHVLKTFFSPSKDDGQLIHKRLEEERKKQRKNRKARSEAGRKSGESRRLKAEQTPNKRSDYVPTKTNSSTSTSFSSSSSSSNSNHPPPFLPNGDVNAEVVNWGAAAEELKRLKISKREATIKTAIANGFNPAQVIALVGYLLTVPADKCTSPAGALVDRLANADAAEWLVDDGWPWRTIVERTPILLNRVARNGAAEEQAAQERRARERERLDTFAGRLAEMGDDELIELIERAPRGSRAGITDALNSRGRDSPLIRDVLLDLISKTENE